jgi:hypothetical protein
MTLVSKNICKTSGRHIQTATIYLVLPLKIFKCQFNLLYIRNQNPTYKPRSNTLLFSNLNILIRQMNISKYSPVRMSFRIHNLGLLQRLTNSAEHMLYWCVLDAAYKLVRKMFYVTCTYNSKGTVSCNGTQRPISETVVVSTGIWDVKPTNQTLISLNRNDF